MISGREHDSTTPNNIVMLPDGGEMGRLIRNFDWETSPLGPMSSWPSTLISSLRLILGSKLPMYIFWGKDLIAFYNDAYRPNFGTDEKHPFALGRPSVEVWPEIWTEIKPDIDKVFDGESTWHENLLLPVLRNGQMVDAYWNYGYSPIYNDAGNVDGVLAVVYETTENIRNLHRIEENSNQLEFAIEASELATWDFNPATGRFTANDRFYSWCGFEPGKETDLQEFIKIIAEEDTDRVTQLYQYALDPANNSPKYEAIYTIRPKNRRERNVRAKGRVWLNSENQPYRFNGTLQDITEQKLAESINTKAQQNLRSVFEQAPISMILYKGPEYIIEIVNRRSLQNWNRTAEEVLGKPLFEVAPELKDKGYEKLFERVLNGETVSSYGEPVILNRAGRPDHLYVDFTMVPFREPDGKITGIMAVSHDVTAEFIARKKLQESEARFKSLIEQAPVATVVLTGREMKIDIINTRMLEYYGKDDSIIGMPIADALPELKDQRFLDLLDEVYTTGRTHEEHDARAILLVNGEPREFYFDYTYKPLFDSDGKIYGVMDMAVDVTEQYHVRQALEESKNLLEFTIDATELATWDMDIVKNTFSGNRRMREWFGLPAEGAVKLPLENSVVLESDRERVFNAMDMAMDPDRKSKYDVEFTLVQAETGEHRIVRSRGKVRFDDENRPSRFNGTIQDITRETIARNKIEEVVAERTRELAEVNSSLKRINSELEQFAYIASHDLQEPVRKISIFTHMLRDALPDVDDRSKGFLSKIENAAARMTNLIKDVLSYSQLSENKEVYEKLDLNEIVQNIISDFELVIEQKNATIEINDLPVIEAVPLQMTQLFGNLISNSLKYSQVGIDPVISINAELLSPDDTRIAARSRSQYYLITISDNGIGFSEEYAEKIFSIFQRLHGKGEYEGTGIGLAICRKIVENHSGTISASGILNGGSTFKILLPVKQVK